MSLRETATQVFKQILTILKRLNDIFFFIRLPVILLFILGLIFTAVMFQNMEEDTTKISNAAFVIVGSLAALSFSCGRALEDTSKDKDRFIFAGERLMHSALLLLTASILKYAALSFNALQKYIPFEPSFKVFVSPIGVICGILFLFAFTSAHSGIRILNELLWNRMNRHKDWDNVL